MIRRSANDSDYLRSRQREYLDDKNDYQNDKDNNENQDDDDDAIQEDETENDMGDDNKHENNDKNDNDVRNDDSINSNTSSFSIADMLRERDSDFSRLSSRLAVNSTPHAQTGTDHRAETRIESLPAASTIHRPLPLIAANLPSDLRSHLLISEPIVEGARQAAVAPERTVASGLLGESRTAAHASSISFDSSRYYDDDGKSDIAPRRNRGNDVADGDDDDNQNSIDNQRVVPLRRERRAPHATSSNTFSSQAPSRISSHANEASRVNRANSRSARLPRPYRLSSEQRQQQQHEQRHEQQQQQRRRRRRHEQQQSRSPNRQNPSFSNNSANSNRPRPSFSSNSSNNTTWADILGGERVRRFESDPRFANVQHEHTTLPQIQVAAFRYFSFGESISFPHQQCVYKAVRQRNEYGGFVSTQIAGALAIVNINPHYHHPLLEANDYTQTRVAILRENQLRHGVKGLNFDASEQDGEEQDEWEEEDG